MGNCLVTKLKGEVNNDNLPKLGVLKLHVNLIDSPSAVNCRLTLTTNAAINVKVVPGSGNGYFGTNYSTIESEHKTELDNISGTVNLYFAEVECDIEITNKYSLTKFDTQWNVFKYRLQDSIDVFK